MNSTGDFLQFRCDIGQIRHDFARNLLEAVQLVGHVCGGRANFQEHGDQPLLRTIMQIAFQPAPSFIGGRDKPRPRGDQVGTGRGGGDRCGYQVREFGDAFLGVPW